MFRGQFLVEINIQAHRCIGQFVLSARSFTMVFCSLGSEVAIQSAIVLSSILLWYCHQVMNGYLCVPELDPVVSMCWLVELIVYQNKCDKCWIGTGY